MIRVSVFGGLGNQMFQYAAGKALAERHGVGLALDLSGFRLYPLRSFLLNRLRVPEAAVSLAHDSTAEKAPKGFISVLWRQRVNRLLGLAGLPKLAASPQSYSEPYFHYDPSFETLGPQTALFGYFQSERYFASIANQLPDWFAPCEPLGEAATALVARIEHSALPISVHIRRGDYLKPEHAEFHGILGESYYRQAITRIEAELGLRPYFFVFSDDPAVAEQVLNFIPSSRLTHVRGDPDRPWEDMALMAHCRHHIIANSSFSWWGAWLNRSLDKIVIAPRDWFAPSELRKRNTCDLYPSGWIRL